MTVVIPAYERETMVADTIRSVQAQTLPVAEILVVDDGSRDRTAEVAESRGVRVLRQKNQGVAAARNTGIRAATQEWVALLDSDDLWVAGKMERQWAARELRPEIGLIFTDWLHFDDTGVVATDVLRGRSVFERLERDYLAPGVALCHRRSLARELFSGNFIKPSTILAPRSLLLEVGLFDTRFGRPDGLVGQVEDRDFFLRLVALTDALSVEESLVRYRVHAGGASQDRIRMAMGAAEVARLVAEHPHRYPEGASDYFRKDRPLRLRTAGIVLMEEDRFPEARRVLWQSLRERPAVRTFLALVASLLGSRAHRALVRLKRRSGLPGLHAGAE